MKSALVEVAQLVEKLDLVMLLVIVILVPAVLVFAELSWKCYFFFFLLVKLFVDLQACSFFSLNSVLPTQICHQVHQKTSVALRLARLKGKVEIRVFVSSMKYPPVSFYLGVMLRLFLSSSCLFPTSEH